ncbi:hypothetical protein [Shewanella algae]|jgi:hypothetical protein|uniref:hypothetical protein n=1 Tax=Shewanella algae TaxID=38313 RepID=UPI0011829B9B|nr:hypothetical protein [Shewanella algae]MBO2558922.1 hypothetical protein [Shewanella algae]MBO2575925.1 hypothetical protein [Shewanella algae]TVO81280.1 hypothetical protein AYI80_21330 [Shewanella algae]TXS81974.1 hypothetical protein AYI81_21285 [Shewanella algae]
MSESVLPLTIADYVGLPCVRPKFEPGYVPPRAAEVKQLRLLMGYSQAQLGVLLGKAVSQKGCDKVYKWELPETSKYHKPIEYLAWRQMLYCTGLATIQDDIAIATRYKDFLKPQSL